MPSGFDSGRRREVGKAFKSLGWVDMPSGWALWDIEANLPLLFKSLGWVDMPSGFAATITGSGFDDFLFKSLGWVDMPSGVAGWRSWQQADSAGLNPSAGLICLLAKTRKEAGWIKGGLNPSAGLICLLAVSGRMTPALTTCLNPSAGLICLLARRIADHGAQSQV